MSVLDANRPPDFKSNCPETTLTHTIHYLTNGFCELYNVEDRLQTFLVNK